MVQDILTRGSLLEGHDLDAEYRDRKKDRLQQSIDRHAPIPENWQEVRRFKTRIRIAKDKSIATQLKDSMWCLFYEMGVPRLSTRGFKIVLKRRRGAKKPKEKELDILAVDDEVAFVVECKSRETLGKKSLKKEIAEFAANMNDIRDGTKGLVANRSLQVVFIIATENITWDENDKLDANENKILLTFV